jgi:AraC-like DNA-binding protein/uncharacterized RmlC-like cupin family protein
MKPRLENLSHRTPAQSFLCYEVLAPSFEFHWHYHPEYELTYIVKGKGKRLVADGYEDFQAGDLVLLPPLVPHTWISEKAENGDCHAIVIQFSHEFVERLFLFSELKNLEPLFANASRGLQFTLPNQALGHLLHPMLQADELTRFTLLLQVLNQLTTLAAVPIASLLYKPMKGNENQQRINKVLLYVQNEFRQNISLQQAASLLHLSESAFCKFFKRTCGKTFSDYTNEIRIAYACQLLIETDKSIGEIAAASGFESLTYFNRVFLRKKSQRPLAFRKMKR